MRIRLIFVALIATLTIAACGGGKKGGDTTAGGGGGGGSAAGTLYDRLGGMPAIEKVTGDFIAIVVKDERINTRFANADAANLKKQLVDQICQASGGPCEYKGKDMKTAHTGMKITDEEFGALVEDLVKALKDNGVKDPEIQELGTELGKMKGDIVGM
jgi:hemoglobin